MSRPRKVLDITPAQKKRILYWLNTCDLSRAKIAKRLGIDEKIVRYIQQSDEKLIGRYVDNSKSTRDL